MSTMSLPCESIFLWSQGAACRMMELSPPILRIYLRSPNSQLIQVSFYVGHSHCDLNDTIQHQRSCSVAEEVQDLIAQNRNQTNGV